MKRIFYIFLFFIVTLSGIKVYSGTLPGRVTVVIDYGGGKHTDNVEVAWSNDMTALEALARAAEIKTHPVGSFVFVTSINGIEGKRGDMAWYYKINGKSPGKLAINRKISKGDVIQWRYTKDVCSPKVDGSKDA